jgi:hypothetical protein
LYGWELIEDRSETHPYVLNVVSADIIHLQAIKTGMTEQEIQSIPQTVRTEEEELRAYEEETV